MSSPDRDTELRLRRSLQDRELDITRVRSWRAPANRPARQARRSIAGMAAVAAVLIVAALVVLIQARSNHSNPAGPTPTATSAPTATAPPQSVHVLDASYLDGSSSVVIGTTPCRTGTTQCPIVLAGSADGRWTRRPTPPFRIGAAGTAGCDTAATRCVQHVAFASPEVGYAYGPDVLYETTDAARTWVKQPGTGADLLLTNATTTIRVSIGNVPHPGVERAMTGTSAWIPVTLPGGLPGEAIGGSASLSGAGDLIVLAVTDYVPSTGNGNDQQALLYVSRDGGSTWKSHSDPCPAVTAGRNDDAAAVTLAYDATVVVDCGVRADNPTGGTIASATITAGDPDKPYTTPTFHTGQAEAAGLAAVDRNTQLRYSPVVHDNGRPEDQYLYRTIDAGKIWTHVLQISGTAITSLSFTSAVDGHLVTRRGELWTTADAGRTWTQVHPT